MRHWEITGAMEGWQRFGRGTAEPEASRCWRWARRADVIGEDGVRAGTSGDTSLPGGADTRPGTSAGRSVAPAGSSCRAPRFPSFIRT